MSLIPDGEIVELDTGVYARLHEGLTNSGIIIGDDSVLVIDSLRMPSFARSLMEDVRKLTDKPVKYVIDTHSHWDHSWGNQEFPEAAIIGHENCYSEMIDVEWNEEWKNKILSSGDPWSDEANVVTITPPEITYQDSMRIYFGGREIILKYLGKAHTSGDTFIHLPKERIVFTGDVAQDGGVPYLGDSYPNEWLDTDDRMAELPVDRFVSGHGPVGDINALKTARDFIHSLVGSMKSAIADGKDSKTASDSVLTELQGQYGNWRSFDRLGESLPDVYHKLIK
tara:strand:- start:102 stop:947 length:846 start_codon:yes stop_codon:yes gene_type:complete